jgi:DNA-directed RNA polymerase subunit RPC12/RpoP
MIISFQNNVDNGGHIMTEYQCSNCGALCMTADNSCPECGHVYCYECKEDDSDWCPACMDTFTIEELEL